MGPENRNRWRSTSLGKIEEHDVRRVPDGSIMAGEREAAGLAIRAKYRDVVRSLIAAIEEPAGQVEGEAAGVVPACPLLANERQGSVRADRKNADAVEYQSMRCT